MMRQLHRLLLPLALGIGQAMGATYYLDFNDGLLPSAKGWTFGTSGISETAVYSVSNGILTGDTATPAGENGAYYVIANAYDPAFDLIFEVSARRIGAGEELASAFGVYGPQFYTEVGIGFDRVEIVTSPNPPGQTIVVTPTRDRFRTYRLVSSGGSGTFQLLIDGVSVFQGLPRQGTEPPKIAFGDFTGGGDAAWQIDYIFYANGVPEPSTFGIFALLGLFCACAKLTGNCRRRF